jgi:hypothetical protein
MLKRTEREKGRKIRIEAGKWTNIGSGKASDMLESECHSLSDSRSMPLGKAGKAGKVQASQGRIRTRKQFCAPTQGLSKRDSRLRLRACPFSLRILVER